MTPTDRLQSLIADMLADGHDAAYIANAIAANAEFLFPRSGVNLTPGVNLTDSEAAEVFVALQGGVLRSSLINALRHGYARNANTSPAAPAA